MLAAMASGPWRAWIRPALSRVWWFLRTRKPPRRLRFTREGKLFVGLTVGVGVAAVNTGNNLLYLVLGLLLSLITLSGVLSEIALRGLEFRRRLPRRAYAGVAALVEIEVLNRKRYAPSYSIEVEDRIEGRRTDKRCYFLKVSAGARQTAAYRRVAPVRGVERYVSLRVATRFPFGLFEKWREVEMPEEQLVYPSPLRTGERAPHDTVNGEHFAREERGQGEVDGVRDIATALPLSIVPDLVGWPREGREHLLRWAGATFDSLGPINKQAVRTAPAALGMMRFSRQVVRKRALSPGSMGAEVLAAADAGRIAHSDCPALMIDYLAPSLDTTISAIASGLALFARHPEQWDLLRADPSRIPNAVNEIVRLESPLRAFSRKVARDTTLAGHRLRAGERVLVMFASANRDASEWSSPDTFDITRDASRQLGFGHGAHGCAGQGLARLETQAVLGALLDRVERIELAGEPVRAPNNIIHGYARLPLRLVAKDGRA